MLERYALPEMTRLWSEQFKFELWRDVSVLAVLARNPEQESELAEAFAKYRVPPQVEIAAEEQVTRHDVAAFLNVWTEGMSPELAKFVHRGMTSSDLVDSANAMRLSLVTGAIVDRLDNLIQLLANLSLRHWETIRIGRTHGQVAEPTMFGYQLAGHVLNLDKYRHRLANSTAGYLGLVKMSGAVGGYRFTSASDEMQFAYLLGDGFTPAMYASQILSRDAYADWVCDLATVATLLENLALQVRLGQQTEIAEIAEYASATSVGSTAMPHKTNPVRSEQVCGLARIVRAQIVPVMEGIVQWSEHDIAHSSVERIALRTASTLVHYMAHTMTKVAAGLGVDEHRMWANVHDNATPGYWSSTFLVGLLDAGVPRKEAAAAIKAAIEDPANNDTAVWVTNRLESEFGIRIDTMPPMQVEHVRTAVQAILEEKANDES